MGGAVAGSGDDAVARVLQVRTGNVGELDRATVGRSGTVPSALGKRPRDGAVPLGEIGFGGDAQADGKNHGGTEKAVLVYPAEHYPEWERELGRDISDRGLGENLRVEGTDGVAWNERTVMPGDVYRIGTALVRVTAPRRPCYKLGLAHGITEMPVRVQATGRTGFYLAVLEPGEVRAGDAVQVVERARHGVTAFEVNRVMNVDKRDVAGIERVLTAAELLPARWVEKLEKRLAADSGPGPEGGALADFALAHEDDARVYG
ncbi:MOSC domain-containing protein [Tomitella fengzijianii]|uniref:MOSC domain-containing protein n=1 Tax=Tomitella fengzijianii TaxID=2597660 RepID=A0A516X6D9_9ACTN|nr:MOSC domain-containing protein [Tomitella fengzijianii]QDQ98573.1 MOSC domain-containing protein [Tomitella fengzijianii]